MRGKSVAILASLLCLVLLISACSASNGSKNIESNGNKTIKVEEEAVSPAETPEANKFPRTVKDANGEFTIKDAPDKVAVVHWGYADSILLFDLPSLALALPFTEKQSVIHSESYKPYIDKLPDLKIVGENVGVNLEALLAYEPDLIIAGNATNKDVMEGLLRIAPTVVIDEEEIDVYTNWPALVTKFGEILGQEETAERYISNYNAQALAAKEKLADLEGTVAFVQVREKAVYLQGTKYTKQYYEGLGLNPLLAPGSAEVGAELSLEGLSVADPDYLFLGYFNYSDDTIPALADEWQESAVWDKLKAVQNKHVYKINGELALGYGPIGHSYGVKAVLEALDK